LFSKDLGIPGKTSCHIFWDPLRHASQETKDAIVKFDKSAESQHEIGNTSAHYSADPEWGELFESVASRRLKQLFLYDGSFFEASAQRHHSCQELLFPILQPFEVRSRRRDISGRFLDSSLKSWDSSPGAIVVEVRFQDFWNNLPGFDHVLGEVAFPFSKLVTNGEVGGWFQVLDVGTTKIAPFSDGEIEPNGEGRSDDGRAMPSDDAPSILVRLKWNHPQKDEGLDETEREISYAMQEELVRSSEIAKQNKFDLVGSSLGAVSTALGGSGRQTPLYLFSAFSLTRPLI
jgi:hypothetical protein